MPDAIALLKADHKKVKALFREVEELGERAFAARAKVYAEIERELQLHTKIEETIFYPAIKQKTRAGSEERDSVLEAYEEHAAAKDVMQRIAQTDPKDETYRAKITVLNELIDQHVKEEETHFFPESRRLLGEAALVELGEEITAAKEAEGATA
jgi:iron-sulfur cluster repair protein YtfE (RIC family)